MSNGGSKFECMVVEIMAINQTYRYVTESDLSEDHIKFQILVERNNFVFHNSLPALSMIAIVMVVGLFSNIIMIVTYQTKLKGNSTYFFVFILALFDVINCLMLPFEIYELRNPYMYSIFALCKIHKFFSFASDLASGYTIIAISFDRYFRFARPHKKFSMRKAKGIVIIIVLVALFFCIFALYIYGEEKVAVDTEMSVIGTKCGIHQEAKTTIAPDIFKAVITILFIGGVIVLTIVYTLLWVRFKQWNRKRQERTTVKQNNSNRVQNNDTHTSQTFTERIHDGCQIYQSNLGLEQTDFTMQDKKTYPNSERKSNTFPHIPCVKQTDDTQYKLITDSHSEKRYVSNPQSNMYCATEFNEDQEQNSKTSENNKQGYDLYSGTKDIMMTTFVIDGIQASALPLTRHNTLGHNISVLSERVDQDERESCKKTFSQMDYSNSCVCTMMCLNPWKTRGLSSKTNKNNVNRSKYHGCFGKMSRTSSTTMKFPFRKSSISAIASFGKNLKLNRTTVMFLATTFSYSICRVPYVLISALQALHPEVFTNMNSIETVMYTIFINFYVLSYAINPLIYSFLNPKIRSECLGLVCSLSNLVIRGKRNNTSSIAQGSSIVVVNEP